MGILKPLVERAAFVTPRGAVDQPEEPRLLPTDRTRHDEACPSNDGGVVTETIIDSA